MALSRLMTSQLVEIVAAGGGIRINAQGKMKSDLMQIVSASKRKNSKITFIGMSGRLTSELVEIAAAGNGNVVFED